MLDNTGVHKSTICLQALTLVCLAEWFTLSSKVIGVVSVPATTPSVKALCSFHGIYDAAEQMCMCFNCWTGSTCADAHLPCTSNTGLGDPTMFEEYWMRHTSDAMLTVPPADHLSYTGRSYRRLKKAIRAMHSMVGNAKTDAKHIVVASGSTMLLPAALYALSDDIDGDLSRYLDINANASFAVWAKKPYYMLIRPPASYFRTSRFQWLEQDSPPTSDIDHPVIEYVTSPNNPDGHLRKATSAGIGRKVIHDHAYYWPHFVAISQQASYTDSDVALFTMSKMSGHGSTRFGWAITSSAAIAAKMETYLQVNSLRLPLDTELKAITIFEHILHNKGDIFHTARQTMEARWEAVLATLQRSQMWKVDNKHEPPTRDAFSGRRAYLPTPAYCWLRCLTCLDAHTTLLRAGIESVPGFVFGGNRSNARIALIQRHEDFTVFLDKFKTMISSET